MHASSVAKKIYDALVDEPFLIFRDTADYIECLEEAEEEEVVKVIENKLTSVLGVDIN
jgi:hypothetical protein